MEAPPTFDDPQLFDASVMDNTARTPSLADEFITNPFSVLRPDLGEWKARKRAWVGMYPFLAGAAGRSDGLTFSDNDDPVSAQMGAIGSTSVFDPVLAELIVRWYSSEGDLVIDPFAGGPARGVVASLLGRSYVGVDLSDEQVGHNVDCWPEASASWIVGDSTTWWARRDQMNARLLMTCPPYWNLEKYSKDPSDLSNLGLSQFRCAYETIFRDTAEHLADDAFAVVVIGNMRNGSGDLVDLRSMTVDALENAGLRFYDEAVVSSPVGSLAVRTRQQFTASRKLGRQHQFVIVAVKGNPKALAGPLAG